MHSQLIINESKLTQSSVSKLVFLMELINLDPLLGVLPVVIGVDKFATVVKTFAGFSIKFPSREELNRIIRKTRKVRHSLSRKILYQSIINDLKDLIDLAYTLETKTVRKAVSTRINQIVLAEFFRETFTKGDSIDMMKEVLTKDNVVDVYRLKLDELNSRSKMMRAINSLENLRLNRDKKSRK